MSENLNRGTRDFSEYDAMATEELEAILRLDAEAPEGEESDTELLLYVMGVLASRRRNKQNSGNTAQEAFKIFKENYMPTDAELRSAKKREKSVRLLRSLTAAAAVLAVVLLGTVTAKALGYDVIKVIAVWAQETFHMSSNGQTDIDDPNTNNELPYQSLQEALQATNQDSTIVPTWIPDGYVLSQIDIWENPLQKIYYAVYQNEDQIIKISVRSYLSNYPENIEQSAGYKKTYQSAGINFFIFEDINTIQAAWITESYECSISGELTVDEIEKMIDSIEKG